MNADRATHLIWCKRRALEYVDLGELANAVASMMSDLDKHPETASPNPYLQLLGMRCVIDGDTDAVRRWIKGFN